MKLLDCKKEIEERQYLVGKELVHTSGTHKIKIALLEPCEVTGTGLHYIKCHYYKQNEQGTYGTITLANNVNDVLSQYMTY